MPKPRKVHTSALCWVPSVEQQSSIQSLRALYDKQFDRWPPHVNVLYPFVPVDDFEDGAVALASAISALPPFEVVLRRLCHFNHGKKSVTAWLEPECSDSAWVTLQTLAQATFPHCTDQTNRGPFVAHLTIGQFADEAALAPLRAQAADFEPIRCTVGELCLISRAGQDEPFLVHWRVPIGGGNARREASPDRGVWLPLRQGWPSSPAGGEQTV